MSFIKAATAVLLVSGSLPVMGAPLPKFLSSMAAVKRATNSNTYVTYTGNGQVSEGWPDQSAWWPTVEAMFTANTPTISESCTQFGVPNNSDAETADILTAINSVSASTGVDARFILAIMMQESNGCVRAPTTNYGVRNPGLMQDHNGAGTCNDGTVSNPCSQSSITQMITDGTAGTSSGDGLVQTISQAPGGGTVTQFYGAARIYNSGSIDPSGNLGLGVATHCYASDVANRLTGWVSGASGCDANTVGEGNGTPTTGGSPAISSVAVVPTSPTQTYTPPVATSQAAAPNPVQTYTPPSSPAPVQTTAPAASAPAYSAPASVPSSGTGSSGTGSSGTGPHHHRPSPVAASVAQTSAAPASAAVPANVAPGVTSSCAQYYTVQENDSCYTVEQTYGLTFAEFQQLNTAIDSACSNLWLGYDYCVKAL